ncbi:YIP1 family protein [Streptomyces niger]|uniref:YIP1 family protein n=1 Tax=Streptomyces niger TaxID=66373 RepID=UPI000DA6184A|nr:YIP1 family protein [Streptomyces niger]
MSIPPPTLVQPAPATQSAPRRRLWWHRLVLGLWYRPVEVLDEARDRGACSAAVLLTLLSGALGLLASGTFRSQWRTGPREVAWQLAGITEAGVLVASLGLGLVTHAMARTLGGNGRLRPTASLFVVVFWVTDLPRLLLAFVLPEQHPVAQAVALTTWGFGCALAVLLIRGQHHLPTLRAVGAVAVQMLASLALLKLGSVG